MCKYCITIMDCVYGAQHFAIEHRQHNNYIKCTVPFCTTYCLLNTCSYSCLEEDRLHRSITKTCVISLEMVVRVIIRDRTRDVIIEPGHVVVTCVGAHDLSTWCLTARVISTSV